MECYNEYLLKPLPGIGRMFSPYQFNGGTVAAIAENDFSVIAGDTRLSCLPRILSRNETKLFLLSNNSILGCSGFWGDIITFRSIVKSKVQEYKYNNGKCMSTEAIAQMISTILYCKRFFPYYVASVLVGIDNQQKGCLFSYDPIGHRQKLNYDAVGSGAEMFLPILDNHITYNNRNDAERIPVTQERALSLLKDTFINAVERDILLGDCIDIYVVSLDGITYHNLELRHD